MSSVLYLQKRGFLTAKKNRILDIGPQTVYFATAAEIREFVERQGAMVRGAELEEALLRLEYFSTPRANERTTFFSDITDLTNIEYCAVDVAPAPKTEVIDLNFQTLAEKHRSYFDVVLNFGTTEHVFNQLNSFAVMHDALKVGGVIYCVLPASGYLDHGYYCYTPLFFEDLCRANNYDKIDLFFAHAGMNSVSKMEIDVRDNKVLLERNSARVVPEIENIPCYNIHAVLRKTDNSPFRVALEVATAHGEVESQVAQMYQSWQKLASFASELNKLNQEREKETRQEIQRLDAEIRALRSSTSWKLTAPLRKAAGWLKNGRGETVDIC